MKTIFKKRVSDTYCLMKKTIIILFVGVITMACSDKPSKVIEKNTITQKSPVPKIINKYSGHLPNGFEGNRRLRPGNYVQLDILATTRNFINIWLPEYCSYKGLKKPFFLLSEGVNILRLDTTSTGGISLSSKAGNGLEFTGTAEEFQYGLYLTVKYHNISDKVLKDVTSSVCIQLTAAPDFRDPGVTRTYWYNDGKWDNNFKKNTVTQKGIVRCDFFRYDLNQGKSLPLIVVESPNSNYAIGLIFRNASKMGGNSHGSTTCIHSDGDTYDIEPGGFAAKEGLLIVHPEGKEAVLKIAREFYYANQQ